MPVTYPFMEVSMACSNVKAMEEFWERTFDGKVIFRGRMAGLPFSRMVACGITLVFRETPDFVPPAGPGEEFHFRNHLGLRVANLEQAIAHLESRGAVFVLTPQRVRELQRMKEGEASKYLETDYIAPPLTAERIADGEYRIDIAILVGPDNLWIEINEVKEPSDTGWFPHGGLNSGEPVLAS